MLLRQDRLRQYRRQWRRAAARSNLQLCGIDISYACAVSQPLDAKRTFNCGALRPERIGEVGTEIKLALCGCAAGVGFEANLAELNVRNLPTHLFGAFEKIDPLRLRPNLPATIGFIQFYASVCHVAVAKLRRGYL